MSPPSGRDIQGQGITPDRLLDQPEPLNPGGEGDRWLTGCSTGTGGHHRSQDRRISSNSGCHQSRGDGRNGMSSRTYHDPLHGGIALHSDDPAEALVLELVDAAPFQRLRRIRQLGPAFLTFHGR